MDDNVEQDDSTSSSSDDGDKNNLLIQKIDELKKSCIDRFPMKVMPVKFRYSTSERRKLVNYSVLHDKLIEMNNDYCDGDCWQNIINSVCRKDPVANRALGCMMGMTIGDSVGAPMEFLPINSSLMENRKSDIEGDYHYLDPKLDGDGELIYINERNAFDLERGQWTDDSSMGFCIGESLLVHDRYHGGDIRVRFHLWWNFGYCSAFRHDTSHRTSVGLGGNISKSLEDLLQNYMDMSGDEIPPHYKAEGEDAGNGSLMRLAPIPIRYHNNLELAMKFAEESSYTTHPGPDAANCCRFLAYYVNQAMNRNADTENLNIKRFTYLVISKFICMEKKRLRMMKDNDAVYNAAAAASLDKLIALLQSKPPSPKEACWNWKSKQIGIEETIAIRGQNYNGYPVSSRYFGSYCLDGLAMALWGVVHSTSFVDCILKVVNLCGDADTVGAIAGQMAGSFYGYNSIIDENNPFGKRMVSNIHRWDPLYEIELRALLLYNDGVGQETASDSSGEVSEENHRNNTSRRCCCIT